MCVSGASGNVDERGGTAATRENEVRAGACRANNSRARDTERKGQCHVGVLKLCYWYQDMVLMLSEAEAQLEDDRGKGAHFVSEALQLPEAPCRWWAQCQQTE